MARLNRKGDALNNVGRTCNVAKRTGTYLVLQDIGGAPRRYRVGNIKGGRSIIVTLGEMTNLY